MMKRKIGLAALAAVLVCGQGHTKPRSRDLGIPFEGVPGPLNAITDVPGVAVGHETIIHGEGDLVRGEGPVRTGVTAVFPRGRHDREPVFAGWYSLNGNGELTGAAWIEESGVLNGPVVMTNTHSVGVVRDAVIAWHVDQGHAGDSSWSLPVVGEIWDGWLSDIDGFHVKQEHVFRALESAEAGPVEEGNVGGGTGCVSYEFKGGIGTASRVSGDYVVGILVQANHGLRYQLTVAGVPVGKAIPEGAFRSSETGSIIVVVATDAPLVPHQLKRLARRVPLGMARTGAASGDSSGDLFIAFSTANKVPGRGRSPTTVEMLAAPDLSPLFEAVILATEEAIVNALVAAETMTGRDGHTVYELPEDRVVNLLHEYGRVEAEPAVAR